MNLIKKLGFGTALVAAAVAMLPGVAQASTSWSKGGSYGITTAYMFTDGNLRIGLNADDNKCDSKSAGAIAYVNAGGERKASFLVANYGGCHTALLKNASWDISDLGGQTSGYVTIYACRVQRIAGGDNFTSCTSGVSRTFSIS